MQKDKHKQIKVKRITGAMRQEPLVFLTGGGRLRDKRGKTGLRQRALWRGRMCLTYL
jgi:hypothetical protein